MSLQKHVQVRGRIALAENMVAAAVRPVRADGSNDLKFLVRQMFAPARAFDRPGLSRGRIGRTEAEQIK